MDRTGFVWNAHLFPDPKSRHQRFAIAHSTGFTFADSIGQSERDGDPAYHANAISHGCSHDYADSFRFADGESFG